MTKGKAAQPLPIWPQWIKKTAKVHIECAKIHILWYFSLFLLALPTNAFKPVPQPEPWAMRRL